jgi:tetratricopeptide (TPR) repeat protein
VSAPSRLIAGVCASAVLLAGAAGVLHARESRLPLPVSTERLMYLRSGRIADRVFLSFDALAADVYWIRAIQHYGRDRKSSRTTDRFALLQPLLDLTTTLDPHFNLAYRFGSIFLSIPPPNGPGRTDQAIALLEKGLDHNPRRWQYAYDIGFVHYWYTGDYTQAAHWFERAADIPGAPDWLRPIAATALVTGGDRTDARRLLEELRTSDEDYIRNAADRGLAQLQALDAIDDLSGIVQAFADRTGRYPRGWGDLIEAGAIGGVPLEPTTGQPFHYDPATHGVTLAPGSPLFPLPHTLGRSRR